MTQAVQIVSCIIDIALIMAVIYFIVDDGFRVSKWGAMIAVLLCCFAGFTILGSRYWGISTTMIITRLALPLIAYTTFGQGELIKRWGKYLLALLFFSSAELVSIFIETLIVTEMFGVTATGNRFLFITIAVNLAAIIFIYYICGRKETKIAFTGTEWGLLLLANSVTFMLLAAVGYSRQIPFVDMIPQEFLQITIKYSVIFLYLFFVISLVNSKVAEHFRVVGQITQENMEQQLEYFKAYKNSQEEIRRYKHDMKNHFLYLSALSKDNKIDEMKKYINSLSGQWESIPSLNSTGSTVVDAIIYGKSFLFEQNHVALTIEGQFTSDLKIEPIDLCTIFTNAIDNAIEANVKCQGDERRYLQVSIRSNQNHYLIILENPTNTLVKITNDHVETDKPGNNHGFGLKNIERALLKYGGTLKIKASSNVFGLEMIIPK